MNIKTLSLVLLIIYSLAFMISCQEDEIKSVQPKEHPFVALLKKTSQSLAKQFIPSKQLPRDKALDLLWSGNGIIKATKKNSKIKVYTHPVNFSNLIDLYYLDKQGIYFYNNQNNSLALVKKGNFLKNLKIPKQIDYNTPAYILLVRATSTKRILQGVNRLKGKLNQDMLEVMKDILLTKQKQFKKSSYIELGAAAQNIMLLANSHDYVYYPISLQYLSQNLKKTLGIKGKSQELFMAISLGVKEQPSTNSFYSNYIMNLIKKTGNANKKQFNHKKDLPLKIVRALLWAGNGIIKNQNNKNIFLTHSGFIDSYIDLYYLNTRQIRRYDPYTDTLETIKFGDYRHYLGNIVTKYKARNVIVIAVKTHMQKWSKKSTIPSNKAIKYYNQLLISMNHRSQLALFQVGTALQNIRLLATDLNLAYQHLEVDPKLRKKMATQLSLQNNNLPVFIIPISQKKTGQ